MKKITSAMGVGLRETAYAYPLLLILSIFMLEISPYFTALLVFISSMFGAWVGYRISGGRAQAIALLPALILGGLCYMPGYLGGRAVVIILILCAFSWHSFGTVRKPFSLQAEKLLSTLGIVCSLVVYIYSQRSEVLQPFSLSVFIAGVVTLSAVLLSMNDWKVKQAAGVRAEEKVPFSGIVLMNRSLTLIFIGLIVVLGAFKQIPSLIKGLIYLLFGWTDFVWGYDPVPPNEYNFHYLELEPMQYDLSDPTEVHKLQWISKAWMVVSSILVLLLAYFVLRLLYSLLRKWLPSWLKSLLERLKLGGMIKEPETDPGYHDELERIAKTRRKRRGTRGYQEPEHVVRRNYQRLVQSAMKKGYDYRPGYTPNENGRQIAGRLEYTELSENEVRNLIQDYNEVRYGSHKDKNKA
ncbi:hypothetical protein DCC85_07880 [Paenibacillus sp. CAA11]|uniref:DUF4129 domain-containing protein n=1 Tax=Paenibacillus sp. CAA11 TaxID=1532905 RepID=UPI000D3D0D5F|nr:DUF4129 domain-containing protein [Paenibacillus sp. CAA11]AWB44147.1 hypothetical protein DCC85_07880 [Paenibacillus sp. CAA11]